MSRLFTALATLSALLAGCGAPPDLDLSLDKPSSAGVYQVVLLAPAQPAVINRMHDWKVKLATPAGAPVHGARIAVAGGMPQHGHGFPTQPRVTREIADGIYLLEGMKFSMPGWWEVRLEIAGAPGNDRVTFNTVIDTGGAVRSATTARPRDAWSAGERATIASLRLDADTAPPADPSNAYETSTHAAALGRALFNDTRLSGNGQVSCASCHASNRQFQDGRARAEGMGTGKRRTMPVPGAAGAPFLFWDGRKDSLWSQALGPLEDRAEHGGNRVRLAHLVRAQYRASYEEVFGPMPSLQGLPDDASPLGTDAERAAWQRLPEADRSAVDRVFANMGKAIAAYERQVRYGPSRFDRYAQAVDAGDAGGQDVLAAQEVRGLRVFLTRGQCVTCHNGPSFTDHAFHNTGVPTVGGAAADRGRADGTARLLSDAFNCAGPYSDAPAQSCRELRFLSTDDPGQLGAFRTPGLRNVAERAPYMHAGQFATLDEVLRHYARSPQAALGQSELATPDHPLAGRQAIHLSGADIADVAAFLRTLSGPVLQPM